VYQLLLGEVKDRLKELPDNSVDAICTDPPYELGFMGKKWDSTGIANDVSMWTECLRVLKPGGHLLSFGGSRTYHRMACAIEDAGFEVRDQMQWIHSQGFPKSLDVSKVFVKADNKRSADRWQGWGTALKPAHEPIVLARKPLIGTVVANVLEHGTGALNIGACRVGDEQVPSNKLEEWSGFGEMKRPAYTQTMNTGRWPANLIHDGSDEVIEAFPNAPGQQGDLKETGRDRPSSGRFGDMAPPVPHKARIDDSKSAARFFKECKETREGEASANRRYTENGATNFAALPGQRRFDKGSAARFFYCAKSNKKDRGEGNIHPTVKPNALMRYLVRLITPPGGVVLDPFCGSGSTGKAAIQEGFNFIGIDRDEHYIEIATRRIEEVANDNTRTDNDGSTDWPDLASEARTAISGPDGYAGDSFPG
jgi:site-specific DNA-methyltransferase (adenine-specific)